MARKELVPGEITRLLSRHGPVKLMVGDPDAGDIATTSCGIVPYEDCLYLFVGRKGRVAERLATTCVARVTASKAEAEGERGYSIDLRGRAILGPAMSIHPRRLEFQAWLPEGAAPGGLAVAQMWTEEVDFKRGEDEFFGRTPAADVPRMSTRWWSLAFGVTWPLLVVGILLSSLYLAWTDHPWRAVPVALAWIVVPAWVAGPALWYRAVAFGDWQRCRKPLGSSGMIGEALLPPGRVLGTAIFLHVLGLLAFLPLFWFSGDVPGIVFFASFIWFSWPVALTRVFTGENKET